MYAVIRENRDRSITRLQTCRTQEAAIGATQREKDKVPLQERTSIRAVAMDDGGTRRLCCKNENALEEITFGAFLYC